MLVLIQKWHERYFVLRANKTIEIHKSRKAAEAHKAPRRVIDLRECISLELGLEYKNLQHILSLGTFKRTFFLGAPSNALMLQWGNVLEKVKGAVSGKLHHLYVCIILVQLHKLFRRLLNKWQLSDASCSRNDS